MSSFSLILEVGWLDVYKDSRHHQIQLVECDDEGSGFHWRIDYIGSGCGMFSDDIWAEVIRMCRTLEEHGLGVKICDGSLAY